MVLGDRENPMTWHWTVTIEGYDDDPNIFYETCNYVGDLRKTKDGDWRYWGTISHTTPIENGEANDRRRSRVPKEDP